MKRSRVSAQLDSGDVIAQKAINTHNGSYLSVQEKKALRGIADHLASCGKGITACDESSVTIGKRFEAVGIANTEENRRSFREMLFTTESINKYLSGAILDPET